MSVPKRILYRRCSRSSGGCRESTQHLAVSTQPVEHASGTPYDVPKTWIIAQIFHTGTMRFLIFNYGTLGSYGNFGNPQLRFGCGALWLICVIRVHPLW